MLGSVFIKMITVSAFIIIMLIYSAIKKRANGPAAYSTLNPDTNSDSPSARSKGARFVSASVEMNHIIVRGHVGRSNQIFFCVNISVLSVNDPFNIKTDNRIIAKHTSYEIVWATARSAPNKAYLEFDAQPDHRIE